jgi:alpha-beta hydrolase superfamily lysophospholipase
MMAVESAALLSACGGGGGGATAPAQPSGTASTPAGAGASEVRFKSGADTVFGTLLFPTNASGNVPGAVILAGSGPTDRDGNSTLLSGKTDTLKDFAQVLAAHGVASLRYDKLGTGETGLASFASHPDDIGFDVYVREALDAVAYLRGQPGNDVNRIVIVGHSEGGLIAMVVANAMGADDGLQALVLASPPGNGYLETIEGQLRAQFAAAVQEGSITQARADAANAQTQQIVDALKTTGAYPPGLNVTDPALQSIFSKANERFLAQAEQHDPAREAAKLPAALPILILHGDKDQQVSDGDIARLVGALQSSAHTKVESHQLSDVDHVFKEVPGTPNPAADYTNPSLPFSSAATAKLAAFVGSLSAKG